MVSGSRSSLSLPLPLSLSVSLSRSLCSTHAAAQMPVSARRLQHTVSAIVGSSVGSCVGSSVGSSRPAPDDPAWLEQQVALFREQSYVIIPNALSREEVRAINDAIDRDRADHPYDWDGTRSATHARMRTHARPSATPLTHPTPPAPHTRIRTRCLSVCSGGNPGALPSKVGGAPHRFQVSLAPFPLSPSSPSVASLSRPACQP